MAIKKKSGLRDKTRKVSLASKIHEFKQDSVDTEQHGNPLLKLSKVTKKEKQQNKSSSFNERLANKITFNLSSGISKSARKRRNRKEREQLKPKLDDLLSNLPVAETPQEKPKYTKSEKREHRPNPQKHTGHTQLLAAENKHFAQVLSNKQFQQSPFAALKDAISQNLK